MKQKNTTMKKKKSKPKTKIKKTKFLKKNKKNKIFKEVKLKKAKKEVHIEEDDEIEEEEEEILPIDYYPKYVNHQDDDGLDEYEEEEEVVEEEIIENKKKTKTKEQKIADKAKYYVDPKQFDEEIMNYYKSGNMSNELALMVSNISHKLSFAGNFINYSYREEMVGDGIIRMMKALISKKYDHKKGTNPFSYFTRIAFNAFRNRIKKEKHIHETHEKYQKEFMMMSEAFNHLSKNNNINIMKERNRER